MPSRKRSAKPLSNLTPAQKRPDKYDICPQCRKNIKTKKSRLCSECHSTEMYTKVSSEIVYIYGRPCRFIGLTRGQFAIISAHRYKKLSKRKWQAFYDKKGYRYYALSRNKNGRYTRMHKEIVGGNSPHIDHINGDGLDNRDENLRPCTVSQNLANSMNHKKNKKGGKYKGVTFCPEITGERPWRSRIGFQNTLVYIGRFSTQEEAARAYDVKAVELFGEFAHTNFR